MQHDISLAVPPADQKKIAAAVVRACSLMADLDPLSLAMDIAAVHANGCSLRLDDMLTGDRYDFLQDVDGIIRHINRETGQLEGFHPHFAQRTTDGWQPFGASGPPNEGA